MQDNSRISYRALLESKQDYGAQHGFEPTFIPDYLFDFQEFLTDWAIRKGRAAIFADCGMGKSVMELVWAQNVIEHTNKGVLLLTPLAVSSQILHEAEKFGIEAARAHPDCTKPGIHITNYERLHHFDADDYAGVICDESSILKNYSGVRRRQITEFMRQVPYRLLGTATAAPNDWVELGTSSEALGYLGHQDMLTHFFTHRQSYREGRREKYYIKGWAAKGPFWQWVASWARACRKPSDLGFNDDGFVLPPLVENDIKVQAEEPTPGLLFDMPATNFFEEREAIRRTIPERCVAAAERVEQNGGVSLVWCHLNDEGDMLESIIPDAVQVAGSDPEDKKEEVAEWFVRGGDERRILVTKPSIFGFGMNFQHCSHMTYFPTHSWEGYYQATRRLWRFGQTDKVSVDRIYTKGGERILANLRRKAEQADHMFGQLVEYMDRGQHINMVYERREVEVPQWL